MSARHAGAAAPALEVLSRQPARPNGRPPLLFVHGICVGAWIWDEHLLPFFADAGYEAHAVSLRGHGGSGGRLDVATLADYAADVAEAARRVGGAVVAIGHSLGGAVVQRWVRDGGRPRGVALLAAPPPWGLAPSAWRMALTRPALFAQVLAQLGVLPAMRFGGLGAAGAEAAVLRAGLFSPDVADEAFLGFTGRVGPESPLVGAELQGWPPFAPLPWGMPPAFVLGGADDRFVPADQVRLTGLYYGCAAVVVPRLAHVVMLDPRWREAAVPLLAWLDRTF